MLGIKDIGESTGAALGFCRELPEYTLQRHGLVNILLVALTVGIGEVKGNWFGEATCSLAVTLGRIHIVFKARLDTGGWSKLL